jgi:hypothetical protein
MGGGSSPVVLFPNDGVRLQAQKSESFSEIESATLEQLIQSRCPSLFSNYCPTWWLSKSVCCFSVRRSPKLMPHIPADTCRPYVACLAISLKPTKCGITGKSYGFRHNSDLNRDSGNIFCYSTVALCNIFFPSCLSVHIHTEDSILCHTIRLRTTTQPRL